MYITICIFNAVILISEGYSGSNNNTIIRENSSICVSCFDFFKVNLYNTTVRENSSILIVIYNREVNYKDIIKIINRTIIQIIMEKEMYEKVDWPDIQAFMEDKDYDDRVYFDPKESVWFVPEDMIKKHEIKEQEQ